MLIASNIMGMLRPGEVKPLPQLTQLEMGVWVLYSDVSDPGIGTTLSHAILTLYFPHASLYF